MQVIQHGTWTIYRQTPHDEIRTTTVDDTRITAVVGVDTCTVYIYDTTDKDIDGSYREVTRYTDDITNTDALLDFVLELLTRS